MDVTLASMMHITVQREAYLAIRAGPNFIDLPSTVIESESYHPYAAIVATAISDHFRLYPRLVIQRAR